jgi:hypothetical protein
LSSKAIGGWPRDFGPLSLFATHETDRLKIIRDIGDRLGAQGNELDDLAPRDRPLPSDHIKNDAPVERRARLLGGAAADHDARGIIYTAVLG